jgi:hypothetical protein
MQDIARRARLDLDRTRAAAHRALHPEPALQGGERTADLTPL